MDSKDWSVLMDALRIISPALGMWAIYLLRQVLSKLNDHSTRLVSVEDWQESHDRLDNERFVSIQRQVDKLK